MKQYDLIIIGGGAAGLLCAIEGKRTGIKDILLIEKGSILGEALTLGDYNISEKEYITGKEYRKQLLEQLNNIDIKLNTMALKVEEHKQVLLISEEYGVEKIEGRNIILTNGAKDTGRKVVNMVGDRCSGIFTVGMAKKILNMKDILLGRNIFIFNNDTLYMIQKELKEHGLNIVGMAVKDQNKEFFGLTSNIYEGYDIISISGKGRIEKVILRKDNIEKVIECDTLIFANSMVSDGLVAMRSNIELNPMTTGPKVNDRYMTSKEGIFACGNGIYIHNSIEEIEEECKQIIHQLK
ncbi:FAD-dependent oxidoreductase [Hathewaya limosa]|uniref:Thioredoxin reductase n=1 Tax=Hathewaya limosa TaxID=1536 RepID=A0ABU0JNJ4_HATLI|nr:FAD-dependent oxidoreductase [Hathewaya limosa]MDQ0478656.1 thioredoxin reductase [Hathewaya limosa]